VVKKWLKEPEGEGKYLIARFAYTPPKALVSRPRGYAIERRIKNAEERKKRY